MSKPKSIRDIRKNLIEKFKHNFTLASVDIFLKELINKSFVIESDKSISPKENTIIKPYIGPESIHFQINDICNLNCPSCYIIQDKNKPYISLHKILNFIDDLTEMGVFWFAIGGGEPLLSDNFFPIIKYVKNKGIIPCFTTSGHQLKEKFIEKISSTVGEIRLSLNDGVSVNYSMLDNKIDLLNKYGVNFGINLIVTCYNIINLRKLIEYYLNKSANTINLIRPKLSLNNKKWYEDNRLRLEDYSLLQNQLDRMKNIFYDSSLTIDCAFSMLFYNKNIEELESNNIRGCAIGDLFCVIDYNGDVFPCCHLKEPSFLLGNICNSSFKTIWKSNPILNQMRKDLKHISGYCGICNHNKYCKGCRAISYKKNGSWLLSDD